MAWRSAVARVAAVSGPRLPHWARAFSADAAPSGPALGLVLNCGSSTLKYGVFAYGALNNATLVAEGAVEGLGGDKCSLVHRVHGTGAKPAQEFVENEPIADHGAALRRTLELLQKGAAGVTPVLKNASDVKCVGHRVVHGGPLTAATLLEAEAMATIREAAALAPLHNPPAIAGIDVAKEVFPGIPQVGVFDTAFHSTMGPEAYLYALPKELADKGVRRYGFHGTSYTFVTQKTAELLGKRPEDLNLIVCHLGSGASMAAIRGGKCVDTTMGMTPLEGLVMGTRTGDIDGGALLHFLETMSPAEVSTLVNKKSGLLGLCGKNDMRSVLEGVAAGDKDCENALDVFVHRVRKYVGSFLVKLDGQCDAIVFTGGIGERAALVRERVCAGLQPFGIELDGSKNVAPRDGAAELQSVFSRTKVMVVPTNEELSIALQSGKVAGLLTSSAAPPAAPLRPPPPRDETSARDASTPASGLYVSSIDGTTCVMELGIMARAFRQTGSVGYFRPVADSTEGALDSHAALIRGSFDINDPPESMYGVTRMQMRELIAAGKEDEMYETIIAKYEELKGNKDFMLVSSADVGKETHVWNVKLAAALNVPMVLSENVRTATGESACGTVEHVFRDMSMAARELEESNVRLAGVVVNKVPAADFDESAAALKTRFGESGMPLIAALPLDDTVGAKQLSDILQALGPDASVLYGADKMNTNNVQNILVAPSSLEQLLEMWSVTDNALVVCDAGRPDIVMGMLLAMRSGVLPALSGIVLTGSEPLPPVVSRVMGALATVPVPILHAKLPTYDAAQLISASKSYLRAMNATKIQGAAELNSAKVEAAEMLFEQHVDKEALADLIGCTATPVLTPKLFQHHIFKQARAAKQRIVLPEGEDPRVVRAAAELQRRGLCEVLLLGKVDEVKDTASKYQLDLSGVRVSYPPSAPDFQSMIEQFVEMRKKKGMTMEKATEMFMNDFTFYGTMKMHAGDADGMVSGACHTTADTMRPALQILKTAPGFNMVSSIFFMLLPKRVQVFGDCGLVVDPSEDELGEIAVASANTAAAFGIDPKVAMLSFSTGDSGGDTPMIAKVKAATAAARAKGPDLPIEGPIQFDAAVDPDVAMVKFKGKENPVAGKATVLVFPNLDAGNNAYKATQQASGCVAMGPIMQGLRKPVNDLSRGCSVEDVVNTVVITCIQAQQNASAEGAK